MCVRVDVFVMQERLAARRGARVVHPHCPLFSAKNPYQPPRIIMREDIHETGRYEASTTTRSVVQSGALVREGGVKGEGVPVSAGAILS